MDDAVRVAVSSILMPGEEIREIAHQDNKAPAVRKAAAIATTHRLIFYRPSVVGNSFNFEDMRWQDIQDIKLNQGMVFSGLSVTRTNGSTILLEHLNKAGARTLYTIAQQQEHEWHEHRRVRQMEEDRARAGGFIMQAPAAAPVAPPPAPAPAPAADDPVERLGKLKRMLDAGLIEQGEYDAVKARILADM